jgi:putative transposase
LVKRRGVVCGREVLRRPVESAQYTSFAFSRRLVEAGLHPSKGSVGDALDNAMCESLIGTLKIERLDRRAYRTVDDVATDVFDWIESWYNRRRRHTSLDMLSPLEYESQHYDGVAATNR